MVVLAALHMGWLKFLAVFLTNKKAKSVSLPKLTTGKKRYNKIEINNLENLSSLISNPALVCFP